MSDNKNSIIEMLYRLRKERVVYGIITVASIALFMCLLAMFTGKGLFDLNPYNTYALQAASWRQGRLDLGKDYPWLELAIHNGKYYCSFPPFPSFVLFPLTFIWGSNTYDFMVLWFCNVISATFIYKLALELKVSPAGAMFQSFFVTIASNMVFVMLDPSVWFLAQTMCFMLVVLSIYFAQKGKGMVSLFFWSASVGCRPMQVFFLPILLVLLYRQARLKEPESKWYKLVLSRWHWGVPAGLLAISYMLLNYFRFGNIFEFGHNYLPEFVSAEYGQFNVHYMKENLKTLFRLPRFMENGKMKVDSMGNLNIFIVSPIFLFAVFGFIYIIWKKSYDLMGIYTGIMILSVIYMLFVVMHKTMGGWGFGNRYANDILPWIYLGVCILVSRFPHLIKYETPLCIWGICLNALGTVIVYNGFVM